MMRVSSLCCAAYLFSVGLAISAEPFLRERGDTVRAIAGVDSYGPVIDEADGLRSHFASQETAELYQKMFALRAEGGGGDVANLTVIQVEYSLPEDGNVVLLIWDETIPNFSGVALTLIDPEDPENTLGPLTLDGLAPDELPGSQTAFVAGIPEGTWTFQIEGSGEPGLDQLDMEILAEQPFADVENLACSEGAAADDASSCDLVITWDTPEPLAGYHLIIVNGIAQLQTTSGSADTVVLNGAPPNEYETVNLGFLEIETGFYRGAFVTTSCELTCEGGGCAAPVGLQVCQSFHAEDDAQNLFRVDWQNVGDYEGVNIYVDDELVTDVPGDQSIADLAGLAPGEHLIEIEGFCVDDEVTERVGQTITVVGGATPYENPIDDGGITCEFVPADPENPDAIDQTIVTWTNMDPAEFIDVFIVNAEGQAFYLGAIGGANESVTINNSTADDVVFLQFFKEIDGTCHGSLQTPCGAAGNNFIRGVCNGAGNSPQITSAVFGLNWLFSGGEDPPCEAACDIDADGGVAINDMIGILNFLFGGSAPPANWVDGNPTCEIGDPVDCATPNESCPLEG